MKASTALSALEAGKMVPSFQGQLIENWGLRTPAAPPRSPARGAQGGEAVPLEPWGRPVTVLVIAGLAGLEELAKPPVGAKLSVLMRLRVLNDRETVVRKCHSVLCGSVVAIL